MISLLLLSKKILKQSSTKYFNFENNFLGGNEFRFFDLRSINVVGQNVASIDRKESRVDAFILKDKVNIHRGYGTFQDINGEYVIGNLETEPASITSDYVFVHFFLESPPLESAVFVFGALSDWQFKDENLMTYEPSVKRIYQSNSTETGMVQLYVLFTPSRKSLSLRRQLF